ncbi:hypothetical protein [Micromonospora sp. DT31]|uniref:hypothetical protein n=1 Tax=Micromonospora sp. DT31 TaxID=3393434 RepID=UPI003CE6DCE1
MGRRHRGRITVLATLVLLPTAVAACGSKAGGADTPAPDRAAAEEATTKSRERVQAYLDALIARDPAAGRSQLCAPMHAAFDAAATGPNGDFADHFTVPQAVVGDVRSGPNGQEVRASVTVRAGSRTGTRSLLFTVTRAGTDWCISGEVPADGPVEPTVSPSEPSPPAAPVPAQ